jgi:hypothetical protein
MVVLAIQNRARDVGSTRAANEFLHQLLGARSEISDFGDPSEFRHGLQREPLPFNFRREFTKPARILKKHFGRNAEMLMERARHRHRQLPFSRKNL